MSIKLSHDVSLAKHRLNFLILLAFNLVDLLQGVDLICLFVSDPVDSPKGSLAYRLLLNKVFDCELLAFILGLLGQHYLRATIRLLDKLRSFLGTKSVKFVKLIHGIPFLGIVSPPFFLSERFQIPFDFLDFKFLFIHIIIINL